MEERLQLITIGTPNARLQGVMAYALLGLDVDTVPDVRLLHPGKVLFVIAVDDTGICAAVYEQLHVLRTDAILEGCVGAILLDGQSELYTKSLACEFALGLNMAGCALIGRPLVEATASLANFRVIASTLKTDMMGAYCQSARELVMRLLQHKKPAYSAPRLLTLYSSNRASSNTYALWKMVKKHLPFETREIMLRNGQIADCEGCTYTTCLHLGEQGSCFYGGVIVEEVYPALTQCDAIMLLCPNYNDALDANITAFINRMTALFRAQRFYEKSLFSIVVSGYSGSDILAKQLISALNMNKSFQLPPRFCMLETANDPDEICDVSMIEKKAQTFAAAMNKHLYD